jgi:hypothetical protein
MEASLMSDATSQTVYFYDRHPISCEIILTKLRASRGHLDNLRPEELFPHVIMAASPLQMSWREERRLAMDRA